VRTLFLALEKRRLGKTLLLSLMGEDREDTARLFSDVHRAKSRDYRYKM